MNVIALVEHLMIVTGAAFVGVGTGSWLVGLGVWLCFVANRSVHK